VREKEKGTKSEKKRERKRKSKRDSVSRVVRNINGSATNSRST
jgi:hypothetical protein